MMSSSELQRISLSATKIVAPYGSIHLEQLGNDEDDDDEIIIVQQNKNNDEAIPEGIKTPTLSADSTTNQTGKEKK